MKDIFPFTVKTFIFGLLVSVTFIILIIGLSNLNLFITLCGGLCCVKTYFYYSKHKKHINKNLKDIEQ